MYPSLYILCTLPPSPPYLPCTPPPTLPSMYPSSPSPPYLLCTPPPPHPTFYVPLLPLPTLPFMYLPLPTLPSMYPSSPSPPNLPCITTCMVAQASIEKCKGGVARVQLYGGCEVLNGGPVSPGVELEGAPVQVAS